MPTTIRALERIGTLIGIATAGIVLLGATLVLVILILVTINVNRLLVPSWPYF